MELTEEFGKKINNTNPEMYEHTSCPGFPLSCLCHLAQLKANRLHQMAHDSTRMTTATKCRMAMERD